MRTTVTLEADVASKIRKLMRDRGISMKEAINSLLRRSLEPNRGDRKPFRQKTFAMGKIRHPMPEKALALADALEDEAILQKLAVRK